MEMRFSTSTLVGETIRNFAGGDPQLEYRDEISECRHFRGRRSGLISQLFPAMLPATIVTATENSDMPDTIQPHILIVDDDPQIRELLHEYFTANELRVTVTASGKEMTAILVDQAIDLVVLDLRLAGEDGMVLARKLREESAIPIIMLTGVRDEADRVMGLELGADDYLTKPFSPRELLARIRTVLRRTKGAALTEARQRDVRAYRFASFELNLRTRRLAKQQAGQRIELTNGEFNLLAALLAAPQRILTRDQLLESSRVYDNEVYDRSIDVQILRLRRKIEIDPSQPQFILTERGVGYLFNSPVEILY
jgi:two-component system, OmpR family, response regulator